MFPTFASFDEVMKQCTQEREAMVIDQGSLSYNISDTVYFYKATPDLTYRIGAQEYWDFSERQKNERELERFQREDYNSSEEEEERNMVEERVRVKKAYPKKRKEEEEPEPRRKSKSRYKDSYRHARNSRQYGYDTGY